MVYPALLPLMRTPRLPVVDCTDAPADLNGLVRFAERRNLVSARVPPHLNWPVPNDTSGGIYSGQCSDGTGLSPRTLCFACQCHFTIASYSFIH